MCAFRKVVLGPTYGFPIQKVVVLPKSKDDKSKSYYMAYITKNKVLSIIYDIIMAVKYPKIYRTN